MADCSKTKVFFEELDRMCNTVNEYGEVEDCVFYKPHYGCCGYMNWLPDGVEKAITVLQKWSNEYPSHSLPKTRQSEFLKIFPTALMTNNVIDIMPCEIIDEELERCSGNCAVCRKIFWLAEAE